jgi:dynactin complex subunit
VGKNNGSFAGKAYFKCDEGRGLFKPIQSIESVIFQLISNNKNFPLKSN